MKNFKIVSLMLVVIFIFSCLSVSAFAAEAVKPTYKTIINGVEVTKNEVWNIEGNTCLRMNTLFPFGIGFNWNETDRIATFSIPKAGSSNDLTYLNKSGVRLYRGNTYVGNGTFVEDNKILTVKPLWQNGWTLTAKTYNNQSIALKPNPVKEDARMCLFEINSTVKWKYVAKLADKEPAEGNQVILQSALNTIPNMLNFSTVQDYFSFNWLTPSKKYMRTNNNQNQSCQGGAVYNSSSEMVGIFAVSGTNYALNIRLNDILAFVD